MIIHMSDENIEIRYVVCFRRAAHVPPCSFALALWFLPQRARVFQIFLMKKKKLLIIN